MNTITSALRLAARGVPAFSCRADKAPACPGGFKAASADPAALRELWRCWPGELVGVPTGAVSGFDALDIDPRHGGDGWLAQNRDRLPVTREQATRSGGTHMLFRHHDGVRNSAGRVAPGIDVRGDGGYIVWWPAAGHAVPVPVPIAPWPAWLLAQLLPPPAPRPEPVLARSGTVPETTAARFLAAVLLRVATAVPGRRHDTLRAAARSIGGVLVQLDISEAAAERVLFDAVKQAGGADVSDRNAKATIAWALAKGASEPLTLGTRHGR